MRFLKIFIVSILFVSLGGCATKLSDKASKTTQEQVKKKVMQSLEEYYKQPFKLEKFNYEYKTDYGDVSGNHPSATFGQYHFKISAEENPIIKFDFVINDDDKKESINSLIDSFKKNRLKNLYCLALSRYYDNAINNHRKVSKEYTNKAENVCDTINDNYYKEAKEYYFKHESEYK